MNLVQDLDGVSARGTLIVVHELHQQLGTYLPR